MFEKKRVWYIIAMTGCFCCSNENFKQGFYFNPEEPQAIIDKWRNGEGNPLASQFARYGRYELADTIAEILPDGRIIVNGSVFGPEENVKYPGRMYD